MGTGVLVGTGAVAETEPVVPTEVDVGEGTGIAIGVGASAGAGVPVPPWTALLNDCNVWPPAGVGDAAGDASAVLVSIAALSSATNALAVAVIESRCSFVSHATVARRAIDNMARNIGRNCIINVFPLRLVYRKDTIICGW